MVINTVPLINKVKANTNWIIIISITLFSLFIWWPTRNLPYHWDSAGFVINAARQLLSDNFTPFIAAYSDFAHPPFFVAILAFTWKLFGQTTLTSHLLNLPLLPLFLISTYLSAKKLTNTSTAIFSTSILAAIPALLAEYGMIYIDLPAAALFMAGATTILYQNKRIATVFLTLALLTKFTIILTFPALIWHLFSTAKHKLNIKTYLPVITPVTVFFSWAYYHNYVTGWWLVNPQRATRITSSLQAYLDSLSFISKSVALDQFRWTITIPALICIFILFFKNQHKFFQTLSTLKIPLAIVIISILSLAYTGEYTTRYGLFFYPFFIIACTLIINQAITKLSYTVLIVITSISLSITSFRPSNIAKGPQYGSDENLAYLDLITIGQDAAQYLQSNFPNALIYGGFPESYQLTEPYQGYLKTPLAFQQCHQFSYQPTRTQIIYLHQYSPEQINCDRLANYYTKTKLIKPSGLEVNCLHWFKLKPQVLPTHYPTQNQINHLYLHHQL